jgi:phosphoribosylformylglycinamidine synthase
MKTSIIIFPGTNCDNETSRFLEKFTGITPTLIWHKESTLPKKDLYVLAGGFSFGDYLRAGAISSHSSIIKEIKRVAKAGRKILGICNGFQILCECGLLPGALLFNRTQKFICKPIKIESQGGNTFTIPIAHKQGNYYYPRFLIRKRQLLENINVAYTYAEDVNGSLGNIAGVYNADNNILGMMPHPERAFEKYHCSQDGFKILENLL